jgi:UrcA family protein
MNSRNIACMAGALFIGACLTISATGAFAGSRGAVVVKAERIDPGLQRTVSYTDLNLSQKPGRQTLKRRIFQTAGELCLNLNPFRDPSECQIDAVHSADAQVAAAIARAERKMATLPVGPAVSISMILTAR